MKLVISYKRRSVFHYHSTGYAFKTCDVNRFLQQCTELSDSDKRCTCSSRYIRIINIIFYNNNFIQNSVIALYRSTDDTHTELVSVFHQITIPTTTNDIQAHFLWPLQALSHFNVQDTRVYRRNKEPREPWPCTGTVWGSQPKLKHYGRDQTQLWYSTL